MIYYKCWQTSNKYKANFVPMVELHSAWIQWDHMTLFFLRGVVNIGLLKIWAQRPISKKGVPYFARVKRKNVIHAFESIIMFVKDHIGECNKFIYLSTPFSIIRISLCNYLKLAIICHIYVLYCYMFDIILYKIQKIHLYGCFDFYCQYFLLWNNKISTFVLRRE